MDTTKVSQEALVLLQRLVQTIAPNVAQSQHPVRTGADLAGTEGQSRPAADASGQSTKGRTRSGRVRIIPQ